MLKKQCEQGIDGAGCLLSALQPVPAILEIPSKEHPYDPSQDSILARVKFMFGES